MAEGAGRLRQLQEALFDRVTGAPLEPAAAEAAGALFLGDARLDAEGRVAVYAEMYLERLLDALREDFPKVLLCLGEERFGALVEDYLGQEPPPRELRHLGARLPGFLDEHPRPGEPWLADLARLEWARADVFDRPDAHPLDLATARECAAAGTLEALPLRAVPSLALCGVSFAVDELWRRLERGEPPVPPDPDGRLLLVWRRGEEVVHRPAAPTERGEVDAIGQLSRGTTFGALAERLGSGQSVEEAARQSFELVGGWIAGGLVANP